MNIPDYLIYDELKRRRERQPDGGLKPLHLPLYQPEPEEVPRDDDSEESDVDRGVIIIDMSSGLEVVD